MICMDMIPQNEEDRLQNLKKYKILYTKSEPIFDQLAAITVTMLNTPIAMINFVDRHKVWTKANQIGESGLEIDRQSCLCSLAILNESVTVFEDITKELYLNSNPLLAGEFGLKFYAAAPIVTKEGFNIGSVCIMDKIARTFSVSEQKKLTWVASMVSVEMHKRIDSRHKFA
ncbi:GAF domain-containing protein [Pedobacter psychroterrae]|uniref:GAF domain-containing protein n=2 Tax=Pedobacter psychroterrae TaxID=2530453 RepID=A0A4R0NUZ8_9SPHI|nr:GAF domain-containing protein [Pedobacter psychroterrae]